MRRARSAARARNGAAIVLLLVASACHGAQVGYVPLSAPVPPLADAQSTLYLVGDAGEANAARDDVLAHLDADVEATSELRAGTPIVVAYLGDNIYDVGARQAHRQQDLAHLEAQAGVVDGVPGAQVVFVPGNHDWSRGAAAETARAAVQLQQRWVREMAEMRAVRFLPSDACPGPAGLDVGEDVHLIMIDTEWLIRAPEGECGGADTFYARLQDELEAYRDRRVVLLAHHPMASGGPHGGNVGLFEKGPLVYFLSVKAGYGDQHLDSEPYRRMIERLETTFAESRAPPFVFAAGHDHTLQVIRLAGSDRPVWQLVSGSASRTEQAKRVDGTRFASNGHGYMRLEMNARGARLTVFARDVDGGAVRPVFTCTLASDEAGQGCPEAPRSGS